MQQLPGFAEARLFAAPARSGYALDSDFAALWELPRHAGAPQPQLLFVPRDFAARRRWRRGRQRPQSPSASPRCEPPRESVACLHLPARGDGRAEWLIIAFHGNAEDLSGPTARSLATLQGPLRAHVLVVELPGYGLSTTGPPSEAAVLNDALVVYSFARSVLRWDASRILLFGFSLGAAAAIHLAASQRVGGLVAVNAFLSFRAMVREVLDPVSGAVAALFIDERFANDARVAELACPSLFVVSEADSIVPKEHGERLFALCAAATKRLVRMHACDHAIDARRLRLGVLPVMQELFGALTPPQGSDASTAARVLEVPRFVLAPRGDDGDGDGEGEGEGGSGQGGDAGQSEGAREKEQRASRPQLRVEVHAEAQRPVAATAMATASPPPPPPPALCKQCRFINTSSEAGRSPPQSPGSPPASPTAADDAALLVHCEWFCVACQTRCASPYPTCDHCGADRPRHALMLGLRERLRARQVADWIRSGRCRMCGGSELLQTATAIAAPLTPAAAERASAARHGARSGGVAEAARRSPYA